MPLLEEISADRGHWLGSYGSLLIMFWLGEISPDVCRSMPRLAGIVAKRRKEAKVSVLSLSNPNAQPPSREARRALADLSRDTEGSIARIAIVRDGTGFVASTVASITAGIHMLAGATAPHRSFSDMAQAIRWATQPLREFQGGRGNIDDVVESVTRKHRLLTERGEPTRQTA